MFDTGTIFDLAGEKRRLFKVVDCRRIIQKDCKIVFCLDKVIRRFFPRVSRTSSNYFAKTQNPVENLL